MPVCLCDSCAGKLFRHTDDGKMLSVSGRNKWDSSWGKPGGNCNTWWLPSSMKRAWSSSTTTSLLNGSPPVGGSDRRKTWDCPCWRFARRVGAWLSLNVGACRCVARAVRCVVGLHTSANPIYYSRRRTPNSLFALVCLGNFGGVVGSSTALLWRRIGCFPGTLDMSSSGGFPGTLQIPGQW